MNRSGNGARASIAALPSRGIVSAAVDGVRAAEGVIVGLVPGGGGVEAEW